MHIRKLDIRGFGKISNKTYELSKGFNIVFGNNESGKSTIQHFIKGMFFGLRGGRPARDGALPPLKKYKPWTGKDFGGSLEYCLDNGSLYRLERNFEGSVRIYDNLFNDISGAFESTREKGAQFAERHLGINEACFEKTAFIRQMETRVGEDGARELLNRLMNVSQTGLEDVSFKKAREVLREALWSHVGTGKTSTRPMDKVCARMEELGRLKEEILKKRDTLRGIESELEDLTDEKVQLEKSEDILSKARVYIDLRRKAQELKRNAAELDELFLSARQKEIEFKNISHELKNLQKESEEISVFSAYSQENVDSLNEGYYNLKNYVEKAHKIELDIHKKREQLNAINSRMEPLKAFGMMAHDAESRIFHLRKAVDALKSEYEKSDFQMLNERIKAAKDEERIFMYYGIACVIASVLSFGAGITVFPGVTAAAPVFLLGAFILLVIRNSRSRKLSGLVREKRMASMLSNNLSQEISSKQKEFGQLLECVGAGSEEEFLRLKSSYDSMIEQITSVSKDMSLMERESEENWKRIERTGNLIANLLSSAGIIDSQVIAAIPPRKIYNCLREEQVKSFLDGINRYKAFEPALTYSIRRKEDIRANLQELYIKASDICGVEIKDCNGINDAVERYKEKIRLGEESLTLCMEGIGETHVKLRLDLEEFLDFKERLLNVDIDKLTLELDYEFKEISENLSRLTLKMMEYQTVLKNSIDDDQIQRIDEELEELKLRKKELEDVDFSLRTAMEVLEEASLEIQRDYAPFLNERMSAIIDRLTCGRYGDLRADDNLSLKAVAPETGDIATSLVLSGGTVDQMYLALRIAVSELAAHQGEKLPFIMDEVFAHYDDKRIEETLRFFQELSSDNQIILFTCKRREMDMALSICGGELNVIEM